MAPERSITRLYGQRIRERREAAGVSQAQAAELAGVSQRTISRWEAGEVQPDLPALSGLAGHFGCSMAQIAPRNQYASASHDPEERQEFFWRRNAQIQGWDPDERVVVMRGQRERGRSPSAKAD